MLQYYGSDTGLRSTTVYRFWSSNQFKLNDNIIPGYDHISSTSSPGRMRRIKQMRCKWEMIQGRTNWNKLYLYIYFACLSVCVQESPKRNLNRFMGTNMTPGKINVRQRWIIWPGKNVYNKCANWTRKIRHNLKYEKWLFLEQQLTTVKIVNKGGSAVIQRLQALSQNQ